LPYGFHSLFGSQLCIHPGLSSPHTRGIGLFGHSFDANNLFADLSQPPMSLFGESLDFVARRHHLLGLLIQHGP
jgi:hypothetical protein